MQKIGLFYGSDGGTTEEIAQKVADKLGDCQIFDVASAKAEDMKNFNNLILATPTYGSGDLQDDWDNFLSKLDENAFAGKTIALLGLATKKFIVILSAMALLIFIKRYQSKAKLLDKQAQMAIPLMIVRQL